MEEKKTRGVGRTRNYTAVVYPDSENTPENWIDILNDQHIPIIISPEPDQEF